MIINYLNKFMNKFEYFYNVIYYFWYRAIIRFSRIVRSPKNPLVLFLYLFYKIPFIKNKFYQKGINDPFKWHFEGEKGKPHSIENPKWGIATMLGGGWTMALLGGIFIAIYYNFMNIFFPRSYLEHDHMLILTNGTAFLLGTYFHRNDEQYIKKFNKKKGFWRIKWKVIVLLSPIVVTYLAVTSSKNYEWGAYVQLKLHNIDVFAENHAKYYNVDYKTQTIVTQKDNTTKTIRLNFKLDKNISE